MDRGILVGKGYYVLSSEVIYAKSPISLAFQWPSPIHPLHSNASVRRTVGTVCCMWVC